MEQRNKDEEIEIDLREIVTVLMRKIWLILMAGIGLALIAFLISKYVLVPQYDSTTKIYVMNRQDSQTGVTYSDLQTGTQLTKDYMTLVKSRPVTEQVISELGLVMQHEELVEKITVNNPIDTRILEITVRYKDPYIAKQIADATRKAAASNITTVMDIEQVNVVEEANIPEISATPNVKRNTALGGVLGIILAAGAVMLFFILDDTIKTPDDVEKHLGLSVLSSIPMQEDDKGSKHNRRKKKNKRR